MKLVNENNIKSIYKKIISEKKVSIFIHEYPDFDALSSALGLRTYLINKKIDCKIIGLKFADNDLIKKFYEPVEIDEYNDEFIKKSIAIVLDTANKKRILTNKENLAKKIYRIDHHLKIETIGELEWIDSNMSSTSEMIGWLIYLNDKKSLNKKICNFLYTGILADSGKFMYDLTKKTCFELVSKFYDYRFNKNEVQDLLFLKSWKSYTKDLKIAKKIKVINNNIAYLKLSKLDIRKFKLKNNPVKVYLMNDFKDFQIWLTIIYNQDQNNWKISIRSRNYDVNQIARKYNGGGHLLASGFKLSNKKEIKELINWLKTIDINQYKIK